MLGILVSGCGPDAVGDELAAETDETTDSDTGDDVSQLDSDGDGLSDELEAEFGTDPHDVDSDDDNYWDAWELAEGTDPLDPESRIYTGWWPYRPDKDRLPQSSWDAASPEVGAAFPRGTYLDQHGDSVDLHDFAYFDHNTAGQPAFLLIDVAAQWCGPCHEFGEWIAQGEDSFDAHWPTVREKVQDLRVWWITFIAQDATGQAPTQADAISWDGQHHSPYVPVLVDAEQQVLQHFSGGQFPHFFLLDPAMQIEFFPHDTNSSDYYPAITMIDKYL